MRVCVEKSTGKLIESQSGGEVEVTMEIAETQLILEGAEVVDQDAIIAKYRYLLDEKDRVEAMRLDTLRQNAINAGYAEADIEVSYITDIEFAVIMDAMKPIPTYADLRRAEYPPYQDYLDAQVKKASDNPEIHNEGLNQEADYLEKCLAVKERIPKS